MLVPVKDEKIVQCTSCGHCIWLFSSQSRVEEPQRECFACINGTRIVAHQAFFVFEVDDDDDESKSKRPRTNLRRYRTDGDRAALAEAREKAGQCRVCGAPATHNSSGFQVRFGTTKAVTCFKHAWQHAYAGSGVQPK